MTPPLNENERNLRFANGGVVGEVLGGSGRFGAVAIIALQRAKKRLFFTERY